VSNGVNFHGPEWVKQELNEQFGISLKSFDNALDHQQRKSIDSFNQALSQAQTDLNRNITDASSKLSSIQTRMQVTERDPKYADRKVSALSLSV